MQSLSDEAVIARFSTLDESARRRVVEQFGALALGLENAGVDLRPRLWRLLQATYPKDQGAWFLIGASEGLQEAEIEEEINELYAALEQDPTDHDTLTLLRELQREHARFLQEQLRASLPVNRNEISSLLTRAKAILDQNPAANNKAK